MKKLCALVLLCLLTVSAHVVSAHVLEFDNGIGAVLHIEPQDEPIAGQDAGFLFEFQDKNGNFDARACACRLTIMDTQNDQLADMALSASARNAASANFVFPKRGTYTLRLSGSSTNQNAFSSFELSYTVRVDKGNGDAGVGSGTGSRAIFVLAAGVIGLLAFLLIRQEVIYTIRSGTKKS